MAARVRREEVVGCDEQRTTGAVATALDLE
jgi:hypothetical protein